MATTLVGNNVANFLTSFAIVTLVAHVFGNSSTAELLGPILMTPLVFVLGELLPKYLFYHAPYKLLTATRPMVLLATVLFSPISIVLGLLGRVLMMITGQTPFRLRLAMARGELDQVLQAGEEAGVLKSGQRSLARQLFDAGNQPAVKFGVPPDRLPIVDVPFDAKEAAREARRRNHPIVLVRKKEQIIGFLRFADLFRDEPITKPRPIVKGSWTDRHLKVLLQLYDGGSEVAVLFDDAGKMRYVVTRRQLLQPLVK